MSSYECQEFIPLVCQNCSTGLSELFHWFVRIVPL